jgi:hypothetical protein
MAAGWRTLSMTDILRVQPLPRSGSCLTTSHSTRRGKIYQQIGECCFEVFEIHVQWRRLEKRIGWRARVEG